MQKKNNYTIKDTKKLSLSIQLSLDGFSFCIKNTTTNKIVFFKDHNFKNKLEGPEDLVDYLEDIFKKDIDLQHDFSNISLIHQNNLSTLVPNAYFIEDKLSSYLNFSVKTLSTDYITYDDIIQLKTKNIYIPYTNVNNFIFQNFGEFEYKHHTTILLEKFLKNSSENKTEMFVNTSMHSLDIIVFKNKKLLLSNTFQYFSKEDFVYYILFCAEQLQLNTEEFLLYLTGNITKESDNYELLYNYVKNVSFLESKNDYLSNLEIAKHNHFILLG